MIAIISAYLKNIGNPSDNYRERTFGYIFWDCEFCRFIFDFVIFLKYPKKSSQNLRRILLRFAGNSQPCTEFAIFTKFSRSVSSTFPTLATRGDQNWKKESASHPSPDHSWQGGCKFCSARRANFVPIFTLIKSYKPENPSEWHYLLDEISPENGFKSKFERMDLNLISISNP